MDYELIECMSKIKNIRKLITKIEKLFYRVEIFFRRNIWKNNFYFFFNVASHCNLNCVGCYSFSPLADKQFVDIETFKNDCEKFAEIAKKYVYKISLMGGEPLLHKDIVEIIEITRNNFKKCKITLVTNGILLDRMTANFWEACKNNKVIINITPYPIKINFQKIMEQSKLYSVTVKNYVNLNKKNNMIKGTLDLEGSQNAKKMFKKCKDSRYCHIVRDGKFYICPKVGQINHFNKYFSKNMEVTAADYIDIHKINDVKELLKYKNSPIPFCRYCNIDAHELTDWRPSKREISEWV